MFKPGDVVRLKGTKMKMTIIIISENYVVVTWFDREDNVNRYTFLNTQLELV